VRQSGQAVRVVERTDGIPVSWFQALAPQRFVRIVRLTIENEDEAARPSAFRMGLAIPRFELVLGPDDANSSEILGVRCSGVRDLILSIATTVMTAAIQKPPGCRRSDHE